MNTNSSLERIADFLFEAGMLRKTPRTGYRFLGSGGESVAAHSFRTAIIGCLLAKLAGAQRERILVMCLFHDFHEARTGDLNYVYQLYDTCAAQQAIEDACRGVPSGDALLELWNEFEERRTPEALLAHDADQLDLILTLKEEQDMGNPYAAKWLSNALKRLRSDEAKQLADAILHRDHTAWWFLGASEEWWAHRKKPE